MSAEKTRIFLDCQFFYVCIDGTQPRRTSCGPGLVYSNETSACERQEKVKDPVSLSKKQHLHYRNFSVRLLKKHHLRAPGESQRSG
jgi:hypothetical protein